MNSSIYWLQLSGINEREIWEEIIRMTRCAYKWYKITRVVMFRERNVKENSYETKLSVTHPVTIICQHSTWWNISQLMKSTWFLNPWKYWKKSYW